MCLPLFSLMIFQMNAVSVLPSFRMSMLGFNDLKANGKICSMQHRSVEEIGIIMCPLPLDRL